MSVPAWPMPIHQTKLMMPKAQATGMLLPHTPDALEQRLVRQVSREQEPGQGEQAEQEQPASSRRGLLHTGLSRLSVSWRVVGAPHQDRGGLQRDRSGVDGLGDGAHASSGLGLRMPHQVGGARAGAELVEQVVAAGVPVAASSPADAGSFRLPKTMASAGRPAGRRS